MRFPGKEIHYSDLAVYRQCPAKFFFMMADRHKGKRAPVMLLGSLFHKAVELRAKYGRTYFSEMWTPSFWRDMFDELQMERPDEEYDCTDSDLDLWSAKFCSKDLFGGKTLGELVHETVTYLENLYDIYGTEVKMRFRDVYGVHVGTIDLLLRNQHTGAITIADVKTSGMWNKLLYNKSYAKQSATMEQVVHHPQMRHYHWLAWRSNQIVDPDSVRQYALIYPANLIPYTSGSKAGRDRGPLFSGANCDPRALKRYEEDLHMWLQMIQANLNVRMYPNTFGKIECPRCHWKEECLSDNFTTQVPEYLHE